MKNCLMFTIGCLVVLGTSSCSQAVKTESWTEGMREMARAFDDLFPYLYSEERFSNPDNRMFIKTKLDRLNHSSSSLDQHVAMGLSGNDPLFKVGLQGLQRSIERSTESFLVENYDYSQMLLQNSVSYCVKCHMRSNIGRSFTPYDSFSTGGQKGADPIQVARAQVATRQFQSALKTLEAIVQNGEKKTEERLQALQMMMAVSIKNLNSLNRARQILIETQNLKNLSQEKPVISAWINDLEKLIRQNNDITVEDAIKPTPATQSSQRRFITDLHNSQILHRGLSADRDKGVRSEILFALGRIYENQPMLSFWELPDQYFEACVLERPHSATARRCYFSLEKRIRAANNLAMDVPITGPDSAHLLKLKALSAERTQLPGVSSGHERL